MKKKSDGVGSGRFGCTYGLSVGLDGVGGGISLCCAIWFYLG